MLAVLNAKNRSTSEMVVRLSPQQMVGKPQADIADDVPTCFIGHVHAVASQSGASRVSICARCIRC